MDKTAFERQSITESDIPKIARLRDIFLVPVMFCLENLSTPKKYK